MRICVTSIFCNLLIWFFNEFFVWSWLHSRRQCNTKQCKSYYNSSSVCLFMCVFVPYLLRGPLTDLRQTWWLYVGGPPNCPWGVLFRKGQRVDGSTGQRVDGSTGHFHFHYLIYDSRRRQAHATPLQKAHASFARSTSIFPSSFQYKKRFYYASVVWNPWIYLLNCLFVPLCIVFYKHV